jgi:predicted transcriptional regulator
MNDGMNSKLVEVRKRRSEVAKRDVKIRIDRDMAALLDEWARRRSVSRGALVERALDLYFKFKEVSKENTTQG